MHWSGYLQIIFSSLAVYLFIIVAIRLFGKKELGQLSVIDLVFILLISNSVQNAMVGTDSSLAGGLVAAGSLFAANFLLKIVLYKFPKIGRLIQGEPSILIYKGQIIHKNLKKAQVTLDEIKEAIREHGVTLIEDVDLAVLENDGRISVLTDDYNKHSTQSLKAGKESSNT